MEPVAMRTRSGQMARNDDKSWGTNSSFTGQEGPNSSYVEEIPKIYKGKSKLTRVKGKSKLTRVKGKAKLSTAMGKAEISHEDEADILSVMDDLKNNPFAEDFLGKWDYRTFIDCDLKADYPPSDDDDGAFTPLEMERLREDCAKYGLSLFNVNGKSVNVDI